MHGGRPAMRKKRPARNILPRNCIILWKTLLLHNLTDSDIMVKILWVDDEIELLKPHVLFLRQKGYEVDTCNNGYDAIDMATEGGYDLAEGVELCKMLEPYVDMFNISAGVMEDLYTWIIMHPSMFLPQACNAYLAEAVKKAVKKPVSCVGAISDPDVMEELLETGKADLVALGRALVADPDLPNKIRDGRTDEIRRCLRCYSCQGQMMKTRNILCTVNPVIGQEYDAKYRLPAAHKHKVAVIGGGPGGMQAALTAAERGHDVTLCEKSDHLRIGKSPGLALIVTDIFYLQPHFFHDLPAHCILKGLSDLHKTGDQRIIKILPSGCKKGE